MAKKIKRRQFGQIAAGSFTTTLLSQFSAKVLSATAQELVYGVNLLDTSQLQDLENNTPPLELVQTDLTAQQVPVKIKVNSVKVKNTKPVKKKNQAFFLPDNYRISTINTLADGSIAIAAVSQSKTGHVNQIIFGTGKIDKLKIEAIKIDGLDNPNQTVESLVSVPNNQLVFLVGNRGTPPFSFKLFDPIQQKFISEDTLFLPPLRLNHRYANLCQSPNGDIFATETGPEGIPVIIYFNFKDISPITGKVIIRQLIPLGFDNQPLLNDLKSLSFLNRVYCMPLLPTLSKKVMLCLKSI